MQTITVQKRIAGKKSVNHQLRQHGFVPANLYGKDRENVMLAVPAANLLEQIKKYGQHALFQIQWDGQPVRVMIKEIQRNPLRPEALYHVDLYEVKQNEPIETVVPLELVGEAEGVRQGGVMQQQLREVQVRCLPEQLPGHIPVEVSEMQIGDVLYVRDLPVPPGVELKEDPDELVLTVLAARKVQDTEEPEAGETAAEEVAEQT